MSENKALREKQKEALKRLLDKLEWSNLSELSDLKVDWLDWVSGVRDMYVTKELLAEIQSKK